MRNVAVFGAGIFIGMFMTVGLDQHPEMSWLPFGALIGVCTGAALLLRRP